MQPLLSFTPESFNALIEQVANLAAIKVEERVRPKWQSEKEAAAYLRMKGKNGDGKPLGNARRARKIEGHWNGTEYIYATAELDRLAESFPTEKP